MPGGDADSGDEGEEQKREQRCAALLQALLPLRGAAINRHPEGNYGQKGEHRVNEAIFILASCRLVNWDRGRLRCSRTAPSCAVSLAPARPRRPPGSRDRGLDLPVGNAAGLVWLWWHGGNVTNVHTAGEALTSAARLTGLLSAYLALIQVVLLARLPFLERLAGFDRLTVWHRWNGHACLDLVLAHVVLSIWGYSLMDRLSIPKETSQMIWGGIYPGMITATVGTFLLIAVVISSIVVVRRRLRYEWWYAVHLAAYAAIALAWFHQIPTGNELVLDRIAADYWRSLYIATLALIVVFRLGTPFLNAFRFRLRVAEVDEEGPGVVSLRISGHRLDRLNAQPGQFFLWRFLAKDSWWDRIRSRSRLHRAAAPCASP